MPRPPSPPAISGLSDQPMPLRVALWMLIGAILGLPVDDLVESINLQLAVAKRSLNGKRVRMTINERLRHAQVCQRLGTTFKELFTWIVSPDSLIRWLKRYQERKANEGKRTKTGRPWIKQDKIDAILRIYDSGLTGLKRIVGEMDKNGMTVAKSTVRRVLTRNGRAPTDSNHRRGSTWAQFWTRHAPHMVGIDFIQTPIGLLGRVVNAFVFFAVEHDTRRVHILGITTHPTDVWVANALRSATMAGEPLATRKHWILDNDGKYGSQTTAVLGKKAVWTSIRAPDMNSIAERWVLSIKTECLNHVVLLNESMLRHYVTEYVRHFNAERPHQGIGNVPIGPWTATTTGALICDEHLDGLLKSFRRVA